MIHIANDTYMQIYNLHVNISVTKSTKMHSIFKFTNLRLKICLLLKKLKNIYA